MQKENLPPPLSSDCSLDFQEEKGLQPWGNYYATVDLQQMVSDHPKSLIDICIIGVKNACRECGRCSLRLDTGWQDKTDPAKVVLSVPPSPPL